MKRIFTALLALAAFFGATEVTYAGKRIPTRWTWELTNATPEVMGNTAGNDLANSTRVGDCVLHDTIRIVSRTWMRRRPCLPPSLQGLFLFAEEPF